MPLSFSALTFHKGLEDHSVNFKVLHGDNTLDRILLSFCPVTPVFIMLDCEFLEQIGENGKQSTINFLNIHQRAVLEFMCASWTAVYARITFQLHLFQTLFTARPGGLHARLCHTFSNLLTDAILAIVCLN